MTTERQPLLNANLRWFLLAMILANTGAQMAYSLLSIYLIEMGATVGDVGLVFTVASLVPMALQILGGWFSDTVGRLRAIALGSFISTFGYLLLFVSPSWEWVMVGLCIEYFSGALVGPSFGSYVAEQSSEEQRGRVFGVTGSIFRVVSVLGPALAGLIAYRVGFQPMLFVAFVLYATATVVRIWMARAERFAPKREAERPTLRGLKTELVAMFGLLVAGGLLTWIWVTDAIGDTAFNLIGQLYPIYLSDIGGLNVEQIGFLSAAMGAATILSSFVGGWLTDRYSERAVIIAGFVGEAIGLTVLVQATDYASFFAAMVIFGLGTGSLMPAYESLISKSVPQEKLGMAYGLFGTSLGLLSLPFPWVGAQLWENFGPQTPFIFTIVACLISVPIAYFKFVLPQDEPEGA